MVIATTRSAVTSTPSFIDGTSDANIAGDATMCSSGWSPTAKGNCAAQFGDMRMECSGYWNVCYSSTNGGKWIKVEEW